MANMLSKFKRWYRNTLQLYRDNYYDTHGIRKNRQERRAIEKLRKKRHKT